MKKIKIKLADGQEIEFSNVESIEGLKKWWVDTKFDPTGNHEGFFVTPDFKVRPVVCDRSLYEAGNFCTSKEYMERRVKELKLYNLLSNFAEIANDGWKPDWNDPYELKYFCYFDDGAKRWLANCITSWNIPHITYFKSGDLARQAIDEIIIPFEKGEPLSTERLNF